MRDKGGYQLRTDKFLFNWHEMSGNVTATPAKQEGKENADVFVLGEGRVLSYEEFKRICKDWEADGEY